MNMNKYFIVLIIVLLPLFVNAQVTIGSEVPPEKAALLDIKSQSGGDGDISSNAGGLLLPRVTIDVLTNFDIFNGLSGIDTEEQKKKHRGLVVYHINDDPVNNKIEEGVYVWDGTKWVKSSSMKKMNFFYMPSFVIPTDQPGVHPEIDLYEEYKRQFGSPKIKSGGAVTPIPVFEKDELEYYITDYDPNVFVPASMAITTDGKFTYTVDQPTQDGTSFINIVFVVK